MKKKQKTKQNNNNNKNKNMLNKTMHKTRYICMKA